MTSCPTILVDQPLDGYIEDHGWVEATVGEDRARELLSEIVYDEDGDQLAYPTGPAKRVHLRLQNPAAEYEEQRWVPCKPTAKTGVEFWQIDCSVSVPTTEKGKP